MDNIKGVIFDLDGTLVDSMWVWLKIDEDYLGKFGYQVPENFNNDINHMSFEKLAAYVKDRFNIPDSVEEILSTWNDMARDNYKHNIKLKSGAKEYLDFLRRNNIKISLATSNSKLLLEACLKSNNIYDYFDTITTTDEVTRGKDFPDVYLLSAKKMNISPENCLVFEDILPAIKSAKSANMKVIAVKDDACIHSKETLLQYADKYITSFNELL